MTHARGAMRRNSHAIKKVHGCQKSKQLSVPCTREFAVQARCGDICSELAEWHDERHGLGLPSLPGLPRILKGEAEPEDENGKGE